MTKVRITEAKRFIIDCLGAAGAKDVPAKQQANLLTFADTTGHKNYGLNILSALVTAIKEGYCKPNNNPEVLMETSSTAWVDSNNCMGGTAGYFAMDMAARKANETGVGWVAVKGACYNCKPYSFWSHKAADVGLIGMVFTNSLLDTDKKEEVIKPAPSRGSTATSKLAAMVDMIGGTGTPLAMRTTIATSLLNEHVEENIGNCFVVVNPACFALGFNGRLIESLPEWKQESMNHKLLEIPLGNLEKKLTEDNTDSDVITYEAELIETSVALAKNLNVKPLNYSEAQKKKQL